MRQQSEACLAGVDDFQVSIAASVLMEAILAADHGQSVDRVCIDLLRDDGFLVIRHVCTSCHARALHD